MFDCAREAAGKAKQCTSRTMEMLLDLLRLYSENVVAILCGDYTDTSDKCDSVKVDFRPLRDRSKRSKSFVKPLIKILANDGSG